MPDTLRNLKRRMARRATNLLDPRYGDQTRFFPRWNPSMTTAEYITRYQNGNQTTGGFNPTVGKLTFSHSPGVPSLPKAEEAQP